MDDFQHNSGVILSFVSFVALRDVSVSFVALRDLSRMNGFVCW